MVQPRAQAKNSKAKVIIVKKTVKYYIYCNSDYQTENKCHDKYFYPKEAKSFFTILVTKQRQNKKPIKKKSNNKSGKIFYFIQPDLDPFMAVSANSSLFKL